MVVYWLLNTRTDEAGVYGSLKALSKDTGISLDALYYQYARLKKTTLSIDQYRIEKTHLRRSPR